MTATARLLDLLSLLQARRDWPGAVLADRLGVSRRTVRRDIDRLRALGYRIDAALGPEGGYRLDAGSELPPLLFDDDQVVALAVSLRASTIAAAGVEEAALRALTTVRQVMPSRLRHRLDAVEFTTLPRPGDGPAAAASPEVLVAVSAAIRAREVLRFTYRRASPDAGEERPAPRRVEPHHLTTTGGRWYLLAWDLDREDWRVFRADGITPRIPTGLRFTPRGIPGGDARAYISRRFTGAGDATGTGDATGVGAWPCTGTVVLHRPAREVLPFAGDGVVEEDGSERCRYTAGAWSWVALAASLSRFDTDIDVVEPPELTTAFAVLATRSAATAAGGPPRSRTPPGSRP